MTLSTVGYGDLHPTTDLSKLFAVAYLLVGVGVFVSLIVKMTAQTNRDHRHRHDLGGPS
jgi:hypothetical protein